jgi:hypothetical protein
MGERSQFAVLRQDIMIRTGVHLQRGTVKHQPHPRDRFECLVTFPGGETGILSVDEETVKAYPEIFEVREKEIS